MMEEKNMNKKNYIKPSLVVVKMYSKIGYMTNSDSVEFAVSPGGSEGDGDVKGGRFDSYDDADW